MSLFTLRPPQKKYVPDNDDRLTVVGEHLLALLAEPPDELADLVACSGRRPPAPNSGWHSWTRIRPKLKARAGVVGTEARVRQVQQWSAWKLATAGRIELAATAVRGACGRIRYCRIVPASPAPTTAAHPWDVPGAHAPEAARA